MIFAFSTSSRLASVAVLADSGEVLWSGEKDAPQGASSACLELLELCQIETGFAAEQGTLFAADTGPGSFTGVRVGIVMAKTFGYLYQKPCLGADAFDLIDPDGVVILPSKRGEVFIRTPGQPPIRSTELPTVPFKGNGLDVNPPEYPSARAFARLLPGLVPVEPDQFVPHYLIEPSISIPKKPYVNVAISEPDGGHSHQP